MDYNGSDRDYGWHVCLRIVAVAHRASGDTSRDIVFPLIITGTNDSIHETPSLRFAPPPIGSSSTLPLSLLNIGTRTLNISDMKLGGWLNDTQQFSVSATSATVAPNQTISVNVTFAPKFSSGVCFMETQLTVVGNQSGGDVKIGLHGNLPVGGC